jgi:NADH:ubiquinone oxidoreductase subunit 6 (subunit J)
LSGYLSLSLSHRLIHHQRPGALQYIYYIGYVLVIVVRDIKGVDGEEEEEREQSKVQYTLLKCMYLFFSLSSLWSFSLSLSFAFFFFVIEMPVNDLGKMHRYCVVSQSFSP